MGLFIDTQPQLSGRGLLWLRFSESKSMLGEGLQAFVIVTILFTKCKSAILLILTKALVTLRSLQSAAPITASV